MSYQEQFDNCKSVDEILSLMVSLSGDVTDEEELLSIQSISREAVKKLQTAHRNEVNVTAITPIKVIVEGKKFAESPYVTLQLYSDYRQAEKIAFNEPIGSDSIIMRV